MSERRSPNHAQAERLDRLQATARTAPEEWFLHRRYQLDLLRELAMLAHRLDALEAQGREYQRALREVDT